MIKVKDIMSTKVISVSPETEIVEAADLLLKNRINGLPVLDTSGALVGIICQSDLIAQQKKLPLPSLFSFLDGYIALSSMKNLQRQVDKIAATTVAQAMTPTPVTIDSATDIEAVAALMVDHNFHTLPVVEGGKLVGIVGKEDILRTLISNSTMNTGSTSGEHGLA
ncbi:MAG: CBS domain-containing protein [Desulfobacteraceae bacterium]|nr:CBS domain-containing protein [Desulfobacteraceae bacterium]